jgi:hypothetical protein
MMVPADRFQAGKLSWEQSAGHFCCCGASFVLKARSTSLLAVGK